MSKVIKKMQMDALKSAFGDIRNMVFLNAEKLPAVAENQLRLSLRKKNIRLHQVKNSLARKIFSEMGIELKDTWSGNTVIAFGPETVKELSRDLEASFKDAEKKDPKFKDKVKIKSALAEGQQVTFEQALKMPTRLEAIGEIMGMILGPASTLSAMLIGPGGQIASQIESKTKEEPAAAPAA